MKVVHLHDVHLSLGAERPKSLEPLDGLFLRRDLGVLDAPADVRFVKILAGRAELPEGQLVRGLFVRIDFTGFSQGHDLHQTITPEEFVFNYKPTTKKGSSYIGWTKA